MLGSTFIGESIQRYTWASLDAIWWYVCRIDFVELVSKFFTQGFTSKWLSVLHVLKLNLNTPVGIDNNRRMSLAFVVEH